MKNTALDIDIKDSISVLSDHISTLINKTEKIAISDVNNLLKAFLYIKDLRKTLEANFDVLNTYYQKLNTETVPQAIEAIGFESVTMGNKVFTVGAQLHASIPEHKRQEGLEWLRNHDLGDIIKEGVNPKTLSSAISLYIEEKGLTPPPEAMSVHMQKVTSVRTKS